MPSYHSRLLLVWFVDISIESGSMGPVDPFIQKCVNYRLLFGFIMLAQLLIGCSGWNYGDDWKKGGGGRLILSRYQDRAATANNATIITFLVGNFDLVDIKSPSSY
jgi:hypothetical protein